MKNVKQNGVPSKNKLIQFQDSKEKVIEELLEKLSSSEIMLLKIWDE